MYVMKRTIVTSFVVAVFLCLMAVSAFSEVRVVAKVGNVPITEFELGQKLKQLIPLASSYHSGVSKEKVEELKEKALDSLIESAYMTQYALAEEIAVPAKKLNEELERIKAYFESKGDFEKALGDMTIEDLKAAIYRKLLSEKALNVAVTSKVDVSEKDMKSYYESNKHRYMRPRQFRASHILLKVDPAATAEDKAKRLDFARELVSKARAGEDFYNLAYYNSDDRTKYVGGDMGHFHEGQIVKELEDTILKMKVGDISDPVRTLYGYSVLKLTEVNPPTQLSYDDVRVKLINAEKEKQNAELKKNWLNGLRSKYKVERFGS